MYEEEEVSKRASNSAKSNGTSPKKRKNNSSDVNKANSENSKRQDAEPETVNYFQKMIIMKYRDMLGDHPITALSDEDLWECILKQDHAFARKNTIEQLGKEEGITNITQDTVEERLLK